jgi:penicillin amidase
VKRWLRRAGLGLIALGLALVAGGYVWLRTALPTTNGEVVLKGPAAPIRISRDRDGLVRIRAKSEADAYFALGFVHAQDRLWQMEFQRRLGAGRLAEILGPRALGTDRFMRVLGLRRLAEQALAGLSNGTRAALDAYSAGVNGFMADHRGAWPPEFVLLRHVPEPWTPVDSLVWGRLMGLRLGHNWRTEALRARLAGRLTPRQIAELWPKRAADGPITLSRRTEPGLQRAAARLWRALPEALRPISASNAWAIAGRHTTTGKPLLANDAHLPFGAPTMWYLAHMEAPGFRITGATVPGLPFTVLGHNGRIAWALTAAETDTQDLFVERVDASDPTRYLTPDGPRPFERRNETIEIKGETAVTLTVRLTRHGPVVSDLGAPNRSLRDRNEVLALATPALDADDTTADALYHMGRARDWSQFRDALRGFMAPHMNIAFADTAGNLGFISPARVPVRRNGNGKVPAPGWSGSHDWTGFIPFAELPQAVNPASGRFVNANNRTVPEPYPYALGRSRAPGYRAGRIKALLDARPRHSPDHMAAMQLDAVSPMARDLLPHMLGAIGKAAPQTGDNATAIALLRAWDGTMDRDRPEPLIFTAWLRALNRRLYADELGPFFEDFWDLRPKFVKAVLTRLTHWCDDVSTAAAESCDERADLALRDALDMLAGTHGGDIAAWRWGEAHRAVFRHRILGQIPLIGRFANIEIPAPGGGYTLNRGRSRIDSPTRPFASTHGAGLRAIYDLADLERSRFMIATGQSGNPLSSHYADLTRRWRDGRYLNLARRPDAAAGDLDILVLKPAR